MVKTFKRLRHPLLDNLPPAISSEELKTLFNEYKLGNVSKARFIEVCLAHSSNYLNYLHITKQFSYTDFDDIMSEVSFCIVQLAERRAQWQIESPATYLYVLIRHAIINIYRRRPQEQLIGNLDSYHKPEISPVVDCIESLEHAAFDNLDLDIIRLRAQNKTLREVSQELGVSHSAIHRRLQALYTRYCNLIGD